MYNALKRTLPACNPPEMAIAITHDTARAVPSSHDFLITPDVDYMISSRLNAFDVLGHAMGTKKSLQEQIRVPCTLRPPYAPAQGRFQ
ncbi:hypothetical protein N658DRAFT_494908 [Parathielavia hyrcaniae]|uniref:Uncharacterized protein n=1 Tax=Parathielavia hyrcaniae TaxID=113614 RepID=A0AAN6Q5Y3_9PEZI|nr:hypothetical protein N658DRAFT_494908 [Parathielavia hyrcaniae]